MLHLISGVHDPKIRRIVDSIEKMLAPIKGYTAQIESQSIDPNGGIDRSQDEQVSLKDQLADSFFKMDLPALNSTNAPYVSDNTDMWIDSIKAQQTIVDEKKVRNTKQVN